jgi:hypothetical protein
MNENAEVEMTVLETLIGHFNATSWPLDVNEQKLRKRYVIGHDDVLPRNYIVEIERHRSILGAEYTRGLPMAAYQTYYMRYAVQLQTKEVEELPDRNGEINVDVDAIVDEHTNHESFSLSVKAIDQTRFVIREDVCGDEENISTLGDAKAFALSLADAIAEFFEDSAMGIDDDQVKEKTISDYTDTLNRSFKKKPKMLGGYVKSGKNKHKRYRRLELLLYISNFQH